MGNLIRHQTLSGKKHLPIVAVLWNNNSWGPSFEEMPFLKGRTDPFEILPNQRYDRMFELRIVTVSTSSGLRSFALPSNVH